MTAVSSPRGLVNAPAWLRTVVALVGALLALALVVLLLGASPVATLRAILTGALGTTFNLGQTVTIASMLTLTGLAALVPFSARLWNVGAEGQMFAGALGAAAAGIMLPEGLAPIVFVPVAIVVAAACGALWGAIPGVLKARFDASEIVVSLMLNFVAIGLATLAITEVWPQGFAPQTEYVADNATLLRFLPGTLVDTGVFVALIAAAVAWVVMNRTAVGFSITAIGANDRAAKLAGIRTARVTVTTFVIGGAFAGLAGAVAVLGIHHSLVSGFSANFGFLGVAVALLARLNAAWVVPSALLLAIARVGSNGLQAATGLSPSIGEVLVAVLIVLLMVTGVIRFRYAGDIR